MKDRRFEPEEDDLRYFDLYSKKFSIIINKGEDK
jgi:hypothetical protein